MTPTPPTEDVKVKSAKGLIQTYRPLFRGEGRSIALQGILSFIGGITEAALLVVVARTAFALEDRKAVHASFGPLGATVLSVKELFLLAILFAVLRAVFQGLAAHMTSALIARRTAVVRAETYGAYARASWAVQSSIEESAVQDLLLRHVSRIVTVITTIAVALSSACSLAALILSALVVDPLSACLVVGSGAVLFFGLRPLSRYAKIFSRRQIEAGRRYIEKSLEFITMSLELRAFGVSVEAAEELDVAAKAEARPIYVNQMLQRLVTTIYQFVAIMIVLGGLFAVYTFLNRPIATLSAIVVILVRSMNLASSLQSAYHTTVETAPFALRVIEEQERFLASAPSSGSVAPPSGAVLHFEDVSYRYSPAAALALDGVSFEIQPGEAVGIIGPSGSGKSTLIQILLRLREPDVGRYLLDGTDAGELDDDLWFRQTAFVPQDCRVLNLTIAENIRFLRAYLSEDDIIDAAKRAHIHDEIMAMPLGYETPLGSRGGALSGGQRQRIAIARALASRPQILVLDEPTSALDMRSEALVHETFTELQGSVTLFVIAHRLSTLRTCDRIMVFGDGRLQQFGPRSELEANSAFYRDAIALSKLRT